MQHNTCIAKVFYSRAREGKISAKIPKKRAAADLRDLRLAGEVTSFSIFVRTQAHPAGREFSFKSYSGEKTNVPTCFPSFAQTFKFLVIFLAPPDKKEKGEGGREGKARQKGKSFSSPTRYLCWSSISRTKSRANLPLFFPSAVRQVRKYKNGYFVTWRIAWRAHLERSGFSLS